MIDLILGLHLLTYHSHQNYTIDGERPRIAHRFSGNNPGVYVLHRGTGLGAGAVRNSFGRWSTHASWTWQANRYVDVSVGVITREGINDRTYPFVAPSLRIPLEAYAARLTLLPGKGVTSAHLSIERAFK